MLLENRNRPLLAAVAALVLVAGACGDGGPGPGDGADEEERRVVLSGDQYVALGDSYTALGDDPSHLEPVEGCGRSDRNYPHQIADRLGFDLVDRSCAGAATVHLTQAQTAYTGSGHPPQLDAVGPETALVTLRIGANDHALFADVVATCTALAEQDPTGSPCTDGDERAATSFADKIDEVESALVVAIDELLERAPEARVMVIGYPQIIPAEGTCSQLPLATGDYDFARDFNERLVAAQEAAAAQAGVEYVDAFTASEGHDICSEDPWIGGAVPESPWSPYHPYLEEHEAVADLVVAALGPG